VFSLARDVLADDGVMFLNHGDSYHNGDKGGYQPSRVKAEDSLQRSNLASDISGGGMNRWPQPGLKPKDLCGQPWRLALALQADGWWWRDEIIWYKRNSMPSSQKDRCTRAHEAVLMFSKAERYYYDAEAIKEPASLETHERRSQWETPDGWDTSVGNGNHGSIHKAGREKGHTNRRPKPWDVDMGSNRTLISGYRRVSPKAQIANHREVAGAAIGIDARKHPGRVKNNESFDAAMAVMPRTRMKRSVWDVPSRGFKDAHFATFPPDLIAPMILAGSRVGDVVLDPFIGSGTVGEVAQRLGRRWVGIDLHPEYASKMVKRRAAQLGMELHT
jgi:site-specific DNA-methyltransferase (cytosine-N4-specific)